MYVEPALRDAIKLTIKRSSLTGYVRDLIIRDQERLGHWPPSRLLP